MCRADLRPGWDLSVNRFSRAGEEGDLSTVRLHYRAPLIGRLCWNWEGAYVTYDPPERTAVRMISGSSLRPFNKLAGTWILNAKGSGTIVETVGQFEPRLPFVAKRMSGRIKRMLEGSLLQLDKLAIRKEEDR